MELKLLQVREATGEYIRMPCNVVDIMVEEAKADREAMWVLHLTTKLQIIEKELVALGSLDGAYVYPRETFRKAVINSSANIMTVHNHPSGDPGPSKEDIEIWDRLVKAGQILGIAVLDHIIITASGKYYSWKEHQAR